MADPSSAATAMPTNQQFMLSYVDKPGATVDRDATLHGQPAIKISVPDGRSGETEALWVARGDYRPLQVGMDGEPASRSIRWGDYQTITPASGAPSPARLSAQHRSAKVVLLSSAAWNAALDRQYDGS